MRRLPPRLLWASLATMVLPACWIIAGTEDFTDAVPSSSASSGSGGGMPCAGSDCKEQGEPCDAPDECVTGFCSDGVCCDRGCNGPCRDCASPEGAGVCTDLPLGPAPGTLCGGFAVCDGSGHCAEGDYQLGKLFGGSNDETAFAVAPAGNGALFLAGATETQGASWMVDNVSVSSTPLQNLDWFFAHFDAEGVAAYGDHVGSQQVNLGSDDQIRDAAADGRGSLYMVGWVDGVMDLGMISAGLSNNTPDLDAVLVKLSLDHSVLWARTVGAVGTLDRGRAVAVGPNGDVVWGGTQDGGLFFEAVAADSNAMPARIFGADSFDSVLDIAIAPDGTVAIGGMHRNEVNFGGGAGTLMPDGPAGTSAGFLAVFDAADGPARWARSLAGPNTYGIVDAIAIAPNDGGVYAGGRVFGTEVDFGAGLVALPTGESTDPAGFVVAYAADGAYRWHQLLSRAQNDTIHALALDAWGNVLAAGQLSDTVTIGDVTLTPNEGGDAVALKFTPDGEAIWGRVFGDAAVQVFHNATFDGERFVLVGGSLGAFPAPGGGIFNPIGGFDMVLTVLTP